MENRETKTIETPIDKIKIVLKAWITGKEKREIRNVFLSKVKFGEDEKKIERNPAELADEAENKAIEIIVVSVKDKTENLVEEILNLKAKDYSFVMNEINKVSRDDDFLA